jgi:hypothetical protein
MPKENLPREDLSKLGGLVHLLAAAGAQKECDQESKIGILQFPWKLHEMLSDAELDGNESIVSWMPDGRAFRVNDKDSFVKNISKSLCLSFINSAIPFLIKNSSTYFHSISQCPCISSSLNSSLFNDNSTFGDLTL